MDEQREKEVQELCKQVLEMSTEFWDNPNGAYESSCPFCCGVEFRGGADPYVAMSDIRHDSDCAYLIAKDLSTNI